MASSYKMLASSNENLLSSNEMLLSSNENLLSSLKLAATVDVGADIGIDTALSGDDVLFVVNVGH